MLKQSSMTIFLRFLAMVSESELKKDRPTVFVSAVFCFDGWFKQAIPTIQRHFLLPTSLFYIIFVVNAVIIRFIMTHLSWHFGECNCHYRITLENLIEFSKGRLTIFNQFQVFDHINCKHRALCHNSDPFVQDHCRFV